MMHHDRFEVNRPVYIIGLLSSLCCLASAMLGIFTLPYLLWHLHYNVPEIISHLEAWIQETYAFTPRKTAWCIFGILMGLTIVFGWISHWAAYYIESKLEEEE